MANWGGAASGAGKGAAVGATYGSFIPGVGTGIGAGVGAGIGFFQGLFSNKNGNANALVPQDMAGLRQQNIDMLRAFMAPGAFDAGGAGAAFFGSGGMDSLLKSSSPEMSAYNTARPILEGMLTGTGPQFERDIGMANATGSRFGSGNAIMRGEALRNLFNQRTQTAGALGALASQAGSSQFDRQMAVQSQRMQLLAGLFGMSNQATMGLPIEAGDDGGMMDALKLMAMLAEQRRSGGQVPRTSNGPGFVPPTFSMQPNLAKLPAWAAKP